MNCIVHVVSKSQTQLSDFNFSLSIFFKKPNCHKYRSKPHQKLCLYLIKKNNKDQVIIKGQTLYWILQMLI